MKRVSAWEDPTDRASLVGSLIGGVLLGAFIGLLLGGILDLAGGFLVIRDAFFGSGHSAFRYLIVPPIAGIGVGAVVGGVIAYVRGSRRTRVPGSASEVPARPDAL